MPQGHAQTGQTDQERDIHIDRDVPIEVDDGLVLRADVFRPLNPGRYPVLLTYGPYAKGLAFQDGYPSAWQRMVEQHPDVAAGSSNRHQNWEVVDPEKWVPHGYVCVRVDSRGCGRSPGFVDHFSPRETRDFYACIEWAGVQDWSNGRVGLNGVSYYGMNQWQVASLQPPHLAAMCVWEGAADFYRDASHHGGILSTFWANWYDMQVKTVQNGLGEHGPRSRATGDLVCGPATLDDAALAATRCDFGADILAHPLDDGYHRARSPDWSRVVTPLLTAANWGGQGLHTRGNLEGFVRAASAQKWLEAHGIEHWTHFYTDYGRDLQRRFFDHFLKGDDNGWDRTPPVLLQIRHPDRFEPRPEREWPLARTQWTRFALDLATLALHEGDAQPDGDAQPEGDAQPGRRPFEALGGRPFEALGGRPFEAMGDGLTFLAPPHDAPLEITGPSALALTVSSSTADADLFVVLRLFAPNLSDDLRETTFQGAIDPHTPIAQGWLRASHRKLDPALSLPHRPYHTHDEPQPLQPGKPVELQIEIWPTSIVVPPGHRLGLSIRGRDYEHAGPGARLSNFKNELRGCGPFLHDDPRDRPPELFAGTTTLHAGSLLLPIIPPTSANPRAEETP